MTTADARAKMKKRLDIQAAITTFDDDIDEFVLDGLSRLSPEIYHEVGVQVEAVTPSDYGEVNVDLSALSTPLVDVREVEASGGDGEYPVRTYKVHGTNMRVRELRSDVTALYISGFDEYTLDNLPSYLNLPVIYFGLSEFYTFLMSNKAKYNVFMQNGRGAVDNMQDQVDYWDQRGISYLEDKGLPVGR